MLAACVALALGTAGSAPAQQVASARACATPAHRQFDFTAGDWDVYDVSDPAKIVARNRVTIVLDGCVLHERYEDAGGLVGESFSSYDSTRRVWHQSWVTNRGQLLLMDGALTGGRMSLAGNYPGPGSAGRVRVSWYRQQGGVRETAETSADGGKRWSPWFDIVFRPHRR